MESDDQARPVRAKAFLVDARSMRVTWMNDAALEGLVGYAWDPAAGATVEAVVPMAQALDVADALADSAATGSPRHLRTDVIATGKGSMALLVSVYPLPDGTLLVLAENSWITAKASSRKAQHRGR